MSDLDRELQDLGRSWRDNQRQPPRIDASMFVESTRRAPPLLSRLVRAVAVVAVLGVGILAISQDLQLTGSGAESGNEMAVPRPGDDVTATGVVVDDNGVARICDPLPVRTIKLSEDQPAHCSGVAVVIRGLELAALPGWIERGATGSSDVVTLTGTWTGDAIDAATVMPTAIDSDPQPELPCLTPDGAWPEAPSDELEFETALSRLANYLAAEPSRFSGYWVSSGVNGRDRVAVVGVVDDPGAAQIDVETVYRYPLCVAHVEHSALDLNRAVESITQDLGSRPVGSWRARVSQRLNRVAVRIPIVDADTARLLEKYPEAAADPLVRIASQPTLDVPEQ